MKQPLSIFLTLIIFFIGSMACKTDDNIIGRDEDAFITHNDPADSTSSRLRIKIGSQAFTATLLDNPTVTAFKAKLPLTVSMSELNGNEKLYNFPSNLPANASNPGNIRNGDLMLYGSNVLVLFYKSFPTQYSYTRLGRIDDTAGLDAAVGTGNVTVTFELESKK
ncbi:cyclophilin-like fold protein [Dyadobacter fanqingshengii]|uniref:Cyclophilin-like domain-containing protein n=1 Tax=Dyadobacter fanqingshengii TaxID=2906443 RepID=A0A9X1TAF7_9BACT|nr:cyclophilin-like fold protein [Dyadobacter fanqingshengii]MCF0041448.1 hypothetical protein [Dyadobacter fanqingshengii]USJ36833.1 cyclophilin-like fold protein [Dyadobacter fanqingshengii]